MNTNLFENKINQIINPFKDIIFKQRLELSTLAQTIPPFLINIKEILVKEENELRETKGRFNIFNCLTRHHLEELHTNFLRYLLCPSEKHDCGTLFLKTFLEVIIENTSDSTKSFARISEEEMIKANVEKRDRFIGFSSQSDIYGKIDIFIEMKSLIVVIENKINADEQPKQLERYIDYCEKEFKGKGKNYLVFYLTRFGSTSKTAGGKAYYTISYNNHILNFLNKCMEQVRQFHYVYSGLFFYRNFLSTSILNKPSKNSIMEIRDLLLKEENLIILKYMNEIESAKIQIRNKLRTDFFKNVSQKLLDKNYQFLPYDNAGNQININNIWDKVWQGFEFSNSNFIFSNDEYKIKFKIEHEWTSLYYGLNLFVNDKSNENISELPIVNTIIAIMNQKLNFQLEQKENNWLAWVKFSFLDNFNFGSDSLNYEFATEMESIVASFVGNIEKYLIAWTETINKLKLLS